LLGGYIVNLRHYAWTVHLKNKYLIKNKSLILMLNNKKIVVIMPAYNAEKTLAQTYKEIPKDIVDLVILTDDASSDRTVELAKELNINTIVHDKNKGYGANQKTCYLEALKENPDIVIMLHPDYQYTPKLITAMASMIAFGEYDVALASRILGRGALRGGMPLYKYIANRILTIVENILIGYKLTEYHTGYRAYSSDVLKKIPFLKNSDDFVFDNEIIVQIVHFGFRIAEISCPTKYFPEASSINFGRSVKYGIGVLATGVKFVLSKWHLKKFIIFEE
jgi:glycosyltransferase involved in cell wall biosynthesis